MLAGRIIRIPCGRATIGAAILGRVELEAGGIMAGRLPRLKGKFTVKTRSWESGLPVPRRRTLATNILAAVDVTFYETPIPSLALRACLG